MSPVLTSDFRSSRFVNQIGENYKKNSWR